MPKAAVPVEIAGDAAEPLGYADASFDAVACTLVLCAVPGLSRSLTEVRRLRPGGTPVVLEHVRGSGQLATPAGPGHVILVGAGRRMPAQPRYRGHHQVRWIRHRAGGILRSVPAGLRPGRCR
ncbi:MAG: methyltransferase domain-containing protein [Actinomycetota bacterium]